MLTFEQIQELIEQVASRGLQGLEIERSGFRLKIEGQAAVASPASAPPTGTVPASPDAAVPRNPAVDPAGTSTVPASAQGQTSSPTAAEDGTGSSGASRTGLSATTADSEGPPEGSHVLPSPIVGTFYRQPSPDADPFAQVGDRVRKGQVLCIVEAMKLMNEIESDVDGEILEIYPENAQPVEYGEPLFAIRAD